MFDNRSFHEWTFKQVVIRFVHLSGMMDGFKILSHLFVNILWCCQALYSRLRTTSNMVCMSVGGRSPCVGQPLPLLQWANQLPRLTPAASILPTLVWSLWARDADACCWPRALLRGKLISQNQVRNQQIGLQKTGKMALSLFNSILRNTHRHCYRGRVACHSYIFFGNQKARSENRKYLKRFVSGLVGGPCPSGSDQKVLLITWQYDVSVLNCRPSRHSIIWPPHNVIAHKYPQIPITESLTLQPTNFN